MLPGQPAPILPALRVLVVDDVDANRRLAQAMLRRFGHLSEVATSGLEAVEKAVAGRYDIVLMDIQMPGINGIEAARRMRESLGAALPRIIAMTANDLPGDRERCRAAGMDTYVTKPIQLEALRAAIEQSASGAAGPSARSAERAPEVAAPVAIDWRRIDSLKPFDADGSMVSGAIASFLADAPGRIEAIRIAHAAGDAEGLASASHALKGAAANIGAAQLQELSRAIESFANEGYLEGAAEPIGVLAKALAEAREALAAGRGAS
jgi:CheY-like chemotaxis protein